MTGCEPNILRPGAADGSLEGSSCSEGCSCAQQHKQRRQLYHAASKPYIGHGEAGRWWKHRGQLKRFASLVPIAQKGNRVFCTAGFCRRSRTKINDLWRSPGSRYQRAEPLLVRGPPQLAEGSSPVQISRFRLLQGGRGGAWREGSPQVRRALPLTKNFPLRRPQAGKIQKDGDTEGPATKNPRLLKRAGSTAASFHLILPALLPVRCGVGVLPWRVQSGAWVASFCPGLPDIAPATVSIMPAWMPPSSWRHHTVTGCPLSNLCPTHTSSELLIKVSSTPSIGTCTNT